MAAVDDLLTCAVCLGWFRSPRILPCYHVYCLPCLQGLVNPGVDYITCPECRRDHVMLNKRADDFPVYGRLEQFMETQQLSESDEDCNDDSELCSCHHSEPACRECQTMHRAQILESLIQESRQFRADFHAEKRTTTIKKQKSELLRHKENLHTLRLKVSSEIKAMIEELEQRQMILLSTIDEEETKVSDDLCRLEQAEIFCAEHVSLMSDLVEKVPRTGTLVSIREQLSVQKALVTSLHDVGRNKKMLDAKFNSKKLKKMITNYGDFFTIIDYKKEFTKLDGDSDFGCDFKHPWGLTVCPKDNLYVTDWTSIRVYSNDGRCIRHKDTKVIPCGLAIDSKKRVIVTSGQEHKVKIYTSELQLIKSFGSKGKKLGQFRWPLGVTCDRNDNIYVVDNFNQRIQVFTKDGTFLCVVGSDVLKGPCCVQINKRGEILVTDYKLGQLLIFSKDGIHLKTITGDGENTLIGPVGVCQDDAGRILVADQTNKKIQVYNDDGTHHCTISQPAAAMLYMCGLAVAASGSIFITEHVSYKVHRIATT